MSLTYGFFNSYKGDRKYNAEQISEIFDGILKDGIIPSIGQLFAVSTANNGMQINVGTGRAWFNHTWTKNDSVMVLNVPASDISRSRYDMVVLEVNHNDDTRANAIKIVSGDPAVNPVKPAYVSTDKVKQYPLAYILVKPGVEEILAENIENMVGRTPTVFATGILETVAIDDLWAQWEGEFNTWFTSIKLQLSGDIVTNLQRQIDELDERVTNIENFNNIVPDDVLRLWGITDIVGNNKKFRDVLNGLFGPVTRTETKIFTSSQTYIFPAHTQSIYAEVYGGGGGGKRGGVNGKDAYGGGGGAGGYRQTRTILGSELNGATSINITIGNGGSPDSPGGTTSFGTYISANGGGAGTWNTSGDASPSSNPAIQGGSGGGGGGGRFYPLYGGSAQYGGGGGAGAGCCVFSGNQEASGLSTYGGNGGTYGGGGGGGCAGHYGGYKTPGSGGSGGFNGAKGGSGSAPPSVAGSGGNGQYTNSMTNVQFKGTGYGGSGGANGGGGGGGGGYGGPGGSGGSGIANATSYSIPGGGAGGGGGGYGARGGKGGSMVLTSDSSYSSNTYCGAGGGGGGGYGGPGGDGGDGGFNVNQHSIGGAGGGGGGGYNTNSVGGKGASLGVNGGTGGNGSGYASGGGGGCNGSGGSGAPGICIMTITYLEYRYQ